MLIPTINKTLQRNPISKTILNLLFEKAQKDRFFTIAGVDWYVEKVTYINSLATFYLSRAGGNCINLIAYKGAYECRNDDEIMNITAVTLATMLGLTNRKEADDENLPKL